MKTQNTINYLKSLLNKTCKITIVKKAYGEIVYVNGQTAFNLSDSAFYNEDNKINALTRAFNNSL